jgi:SAM-dependent methyltransferase
VASPRLRAVPGSVADGCTVCGATARTEILSAAAIARQLKWLERFHRRRLKPSAARRRAALEDRAEFTQDEPRAIVSCRGCGLVFRHPRRSSAAVERDYATDRYGEARLRALAAAQARAYDGKIATLGRWLARRRQVRIVEVGSFVGGFLCAARAAGWDAVGVDPGEEVVSFCRARDLTVHEGTIEELTLPLGTTDIVAVWNTFDQIADPQPTLAAAARLLRPGGILALRVPHGRFFADAAVRMRRDGAIARRLRSLTLAWNNLIGFPYLHGYTVGTLDRALAAHGFERLHVVPDTLLPLADVDTRRWALLEERAVKALCRMRWNRHVDGPARWAAAPWLDLYYRRPGGVPTR